MATADMLDRISLEASVLRCGYDAGVFDKEAIERWAELQISRLDDPLSELIELATIRRAHPVDVIKLLRSLAAGIPSSQSVETQIGFVGLAFEAGRLSLVGAKRGLWSLLHVEGITHEQEAAIYCIDDGYDLALCGSYGTMEDVERQLREFTKPYAERMKAGFGEILALANEPQ